MKVGDILQTNSFNAQFKDPRWAEFSDGIKRERGHYCEICRRQDVILEAHHIFYEPTLKLWEYEKEAIIVLCRGCHKAMHAELNKFRKHVFSKLTPQTLEVLNLALSVGLSGNDPLDFVHAVREMATSPSAVKRFAYAWNNGKKPEPNKDYNPTENKPETIQTNWQADPRRREGAD